MPLKCTARNVQKLIKQNVLRAPPAGCLLSIPSPCQQTQFGVCLFKKLENMEGKTNSTFLLFVIAINQHGLPASPVLLPTCSLTFQIEMLCREAEVNAGSRAVWELQRSTREAWHTVTAGQAETSAVGTVQKQEWSRSGKTNQV